MLPERDRIPDGNAVNVTGKPLLAVAVKMPVFVLNGSAIVVGEMAENVMVWLGGVTTELIMREGTSPTVVIDRPYEHASTALPWISNWTPDPSTAWEAGVKADVYLAVPTVRVISDM